MRAIYFRLLQDVRLFIKKKKFVTRGAPFAKKMWRDGYNKALDDLLYYLESSFRDKGNGELPSPVARPFSQA